MLTLPEIQVELDRVTYRQGWTFTTYQDEWEGPHLLIVAPVPNAYRPGQLVDLGIRSPLPPMPDATYLHRWLAWRLGRVESHECREMLRVGGTAPFDPHAEEPQHIRVLKRLGQWHWWCPTCMGGDWGPVWMDAIHQAERHAQHHALVH